MNKPTVDSKFIVNLKGKEFVQYEGLLDLAHQGELQEIKTELIQLPTKDNGNQCIVKAVAIGPSKHFEGHGDADPTNVNSMIAKHLIRMAETRAKARALRDYTNVGMTAIEELGGEEEGQTKPTPTNSNKALTEPQIKRLYAIANGVGVNADKVKEQVSQRFNKEVNNLTKAEYDLVCKGYEGMKK